ncbi:hypothetical protein, partial [Klebsiella pneumoniae]|uniref:hypothetical protein n=1 Tax=Klebsiella pneumoniae TaxID=573 RepID=UPI0040557E94
MSWSSCPEKVKAIAELAVPRNLKEVRGFLGMVGYYRKFIKDFAELTEPLTKLLRKNEKFKITTEFP